MTPELLAIAGLIMLAGGAVVCLLIAAVAIARADGLPGLIRVVAPIAAVGAALCSVAVVWRMLMALR